LDATVISNELAADSSPSALQVVGDGLLRDLVRVVDRSYFANTTSNGPAGLLSITPTTADAGDTWSNFDAFEFAKSNAEQHNTIVDTLVCNPATALKLATLKESSVAGSNRALLQSDPTAPRRTHRVRRTTDHLTDHRKRYCLGLAESANQCGAQAKCHSRARPQRLLHQLEDRD
jgi:HK97 family phage major capsid protein